MIKIDDHAVTLSPRPDLRIPLAPAAGERAGVRGLVCPDDNEVEVAPRRETNPEDGGLSAVPTPADANPVPLAPTRTSSPPSETAPRPAMTLAAAPPSAWYRGADIARATGDASKKTVHARALREAWPWRKAGNRFEYQPPALIAALLGEFRAACVEVAKADLPVAYSQLNAAARRKVLGREAACLRYAELTAEHGVERALALTVADFAGRAEPFVFSTNRLRLWRDLYKAFGLAGLVEQKTGRVGQKSAASKCRPETLVRLKAKALEHGSVARGFRVLQRDPTLDANEREIFHAARASKSSVPKSLVEAGRVASLTADLAQGPQHARLHGRFTPTLCDCAPGAKFVGDDMTSNILVWCEWPNARGCIIGQPQVLPVMDVGSLRWLNVRCIMRAGGQYTSDDVWGLYGDVFDTFGLPQDGFVSEFGHWQGNRVKGHKTGLTDEDRIGGLASLGLKIFKSYDPRTKIIETCFNQLQYILDANPGYAGRDQRKQLPESVKRWRQECESGHAHPRQHFMHLSQFSDAVQAAMEEWNHERNDGETLRGESPLEKWTATAPALRAIPDQARWLYRSAMSVCQVTRNGLRITQGSGAKQLVYYYDAPALLTPRVGQKVTVYWNDHNPQADAIVLAGTPRQFIGSAQFVPRLSRFDATPAQLGAEAARKKAALHYSRTELRSIQPEMNRAAKPIPYDDAAGNIGAEINLAAAKAEAVQRTEKAIATHVQASRMDWSELGDDAPPAPRYTPPVESVTDDDMEELSGGGPPKKTYYLHGGHGGNRKYVDYLVARLTEFRQAGASFGQKFKGPITAGITHKITASQIGGDIYAAENFEKVCLHLKEKIDGTILGKRNAAKGTRNYHELSEHE